MDIGSAIQALYPNLVPRVDYLLQDDGQGAYIKSWTNSNPYPTQSDLQNGWYLWTRRDKADEIVLDFNEAIKALYPVALHTDYAWHVELMYAIATNNTAQRTSLQNLVQKRRRAEQALSQADTIEEVEAITFGAA